MISFVVCSVDTVLLSKFSENLAATVSVPYEVIAIDNTIANRGICAIYNSGVQQAKYEMICFCHEDILFETDHWDKELAHLLNDRSIGLVGVAGAVFKSSYPTSWIAIPTNYYRSNLVQVQSDGKYSYEPIWSDGDYSEVVVLDGCFIAGRKEVFKEHPWNEKLLKGFHLYDMDISLRMGTTYKNVVSNKIKIVHLSEGNMDNKWMAESERFHHHYKDKLPLTRLVNNPAEVKALEYYSLRAYFFKLSILKQSFFKRLGIIFKAFSLSPRKKDNLSMLKWLFLPHNNS